MTKRKRTSRIASPTDMAAMFLHSDGYDGRMLPIPDDGPLFDTPALAEAAWPSWRARTWALWLDWSRDLTDPPDAAMAWDALTNVTRRLGWPLCTVDPESVAAAVETDVAAVEEWRTAHPKDASEVADALDVLVANLRLTARLAEQTAWDPEAARAARLAMPHPGKVA